MKVSTGNFVLKFYLNGEFKESAVQQKSLECITQLKAFCISVYLNFKTGTFLFLSNLPPLISLRLCC